MKYQNRKNNKIATLVSEDARCKTVILEFEDGSNTKITTSTLKRWWKALPEEEVSDDEYVAEVMQQKADLGIECPKIEAIEIVEPLIDLDNPISEEEAKQRGMIGGDEAVELAVVDPGDVAGDGTPLAEVGKQIYEQAKKKAAKAKAEKKQTSKKSKRVDRTPVWEKLSKDVAAVKGVSEFRDRGKFIASIWVEGKTLFEIRLSQSGGTIRVRPALADKCELQYSLVDKYYLSAFVKLEDDEIVRTVKMLVKEGGN